MKQRKIRNVKIFNPQPVEKIKRAVLVGFQAKESDLRTRSRKGSLPMVRHALSHCLWRYTNLKQEQIAKIIHRDRSMVVHGIAEVESKCKTYPDIREKIISIETEIDN